MNFDKTYFEQVEDFALQDIVHVIHAQSVEKSLSLAIQETF